MSNRSKQVKEVVDLAKSLQTSMLQVDATVARLAKAFDLVVDSTAKASKQVKEQKDYYQKGYEQLLGIKNLNKDLKKELEDQAKSAKIKTLALKTGVDVQIVELQLAKQDAIARAQSAGASKEMLQSIRDQYDESIKRTKDLVKQQELQKKEAELSERIKEYDKEKHELLEKIETKQRLIKDIITDQRAAQAVFIGQLIKGADQISEVFSEIRAEGLTVTQAFHESGLALGATFSLSGATMKDNAEIMAGMRKEMGSMHDISKDTVVEMGKLSKTLGISAQQAGQLQGQFQSMPGSTAETATNTLEYAGALAKAAHVAPGDVMAEIANNAEATAIYAKDGGKNIATAAVAAKKLGVEFGTINKMADGLLDFENSINKQMEASVLLGKEINLDKAREAALNGDLVGATEDMLKNIGGEAEFNKMNVVQRKALADSMGISVQELSKMVKNQDKLKDLTEEQRNALADGSMTMDEVLANSKGVAARFGDMALSAGAGFMSIGGMAKGLRESLDTTKGLIKGFKDGAGLAGKISGAFKGGLSGATEKGADVAGGAANKAGDLGDKAKKAPSPQAGVGIRLFLKNLAAGLKSFANPKVLAGAAVMAGSLVLFGAGMVVMAKVLSMVPLTDLLVAAIALPAFAGGFYLMTKALGKITLKDAVIGSLALALIGAAMIPAAYAFSLLADVPIENMIAFALMLPILAIGVMALGMALAGPQAALFMLGIAALAMLGGVLIVLGAGLLVAGVGMEKFANSATAVIANLKPIAESISAMSAMVVPLMGIATALMGIGAGLYFMSAAGLTAMPILGMLIGLAAVAPALSGLANALMGGGGEGESNGKMDELIAEVKSLKAEMANITVNLDGKKVGEALRGSMNTSRIR